MRKIKEVLRQKLMLGLTDSQIARSCSISRSTVAAYIRRAEESDLGWPLPEDLDDGTLERRLFGRTPKKGRRRAEPDFKAIHGELQRDRDVTMQLLWREYKEANPEGYQYSQFTHLYREWTKKLDLVMRQSHRAGDKLFVDYAGRKVEITDGQTGNKTEASIFVAVLGASSYTYAEAAAKQDLSSWIGAHIRTFEFMGGCPAVVVPDNLKTGVLRPCRYEPDLNPTYQEMAAHYGVAVIPARVRKPRDKAKVENGVQVVERWILAALRGRTFFSIAELNRAIWELLEHLNNRRFRKLPGSRAELFGTVDRPALQPLPAERYSFAEWKQAKVNIDYHVELERHLYSVPYSLVGRKVELRYTSTTVEVLHRGARVASHRRSYQPGGATTINEHRPQSHQRHLSWTPSRLMEWAGKAGPATAAMAESILQSRRHPEQSYRSCLGLIRLGERFGQERLEAACTRALKFNARSYKSVRSILEAGLDRQQLSSAASGPPLLHENIRGAGYFNLEKEGRNAD
jgi:transposase